MPAHLEDPEEAFLAAREHEAEGRLDEALAALLALRTRLGNTTAALEMQIASVHMRRGNARDALEALHSAVALKPDLAGAHKNIAALLASLGQTGEAREALRRAVAAVPHDATLWVRLASAETHMGDAAASLRALARAVEAMPPTAAAWREIGQGYAEHWHYAEADRALALASALDPGAPPTETLAAFVKQELGDTAGALQALARAAARDPDSLSVALGERLMLPQVYEGVDDVARWRARYTEGLDSVVRDAGRFLPRAREVLDLNRQNFLLAYQGEDDTSLQQGYSGLLARLIDSAHPELRAPRPIRFDGARRLRVGFVGGIFRDCTAGRYFERWITALDPRRFERFVYHSASVADDFTRRIADASEHFATLRAGALDTATRIAADDLDVLVHPEVGMSSVSYLLAAMRLAPVQAAGWGHPVTTGADTIDHFFTCAAMEPEDGEAHYVERLVRLPGLGVGYGMPSPPPPGTRAQVGLPEGRRLYVCAQSLFKVHPEMDAILADIVARDPDAVLVFFQASARRVTEALAGRVQRALAERGVSPRGQIKFLPRMESAHFRRVLALADVVLDTPRWSGGNTSIDAFAAGVPVVTVPGRFMRGRQTAGMLGLMELDGLVARDADDYVRLAIEVARDRGPDLRREIAGRRAVLFDRPEPLAAFADALLRMGAGEMRAR
jgi:CRISPR-associated protein Csy1